jgi:antitoxin CptB
MTGKIGLEKRRKRLTFRAKHRGIKEADIMIGSFVETFANSFSQEDCAWLELIFEETDYDILNWVTKKGPPPPEFDTPLMTRMQQIDYIPIDNNPREGK